MMLAKTTKKQKNRIYANAEKTTKNEGKKFWKLKNFLNKENTFQIIYQGFIQGLLTLLSFFIGRKYFSFEVGQTMAFITIIFIQLFHSLNNRSLTKSIFKNGHNIYLYMAILITMGLQFLIILIPSLASVFKVVTIGYKEWIIAVLLSFLIIPLVEVTKFITKKYSH